MRLLGLVLALGWLAGCEGDDEEIPEVCQEISDACHEPGEAGDAASEACHDIAHAADEADCEAEHDACIDTCEAAAAV